MSQAFCTHCGVAITAGSASCAACGAPLQAVTAPSGFDSQLSSAPDASVPLPMATAGVVTKKRPLTFGDKIIIGLVMIGFLVVGFVITEAKIRARHPQWHHHH